MTCDRYFELLSARLDGVLTEDEERALEEHQAGCPDCRAAGAQLAALRAGFGELEDVPAPEGFAQGVMERIRAEERPKVIPLFKRPQVRALAGLAACLVLAVGLYSAARFPQENADGEDFDLITRSFNRDAGAEEPEDIPQIAAYSDSDAPVEDSIYGAQKSVPDAVYYGAAPIPAAPMGSTKVLTLDRMPEGGWELIPPETPVSPEGIHVTGELLEQMERLAAEQGITAELTSGAESAEEFVIVVLEETE